MSTKKWRRALTFVRSGTAVLVLLLISVVEVPAGDTNAAGSEQQVGCHTDESSDEGEPHSGFHDLKGRAAEQNCDVDRVRDEKERKRMEQYIAEYVRKEDIVHSLKLPSGEMVDCVDMHKQPALRRAGMENHKLQLRPSGEPKEDQYSEFPQAQDKDPAPAERLQSLKQEFLSAGEGCPERSVPIKRLTMDILKNFETLEDFFRKRPPHLVDGPNNEHQYAHAERSGDNWGGQTVLNVWSPYTERASEFSLSQMWVVRGSGDNRETVEAGWQKYRDLYGDYRPRLFIYFTPDNYGDDGCYNLTCGAFVQANNTIYIGGGFTNVSAHPHPSTAWEFKLRWQKDDTQGHWWLKYGDTWVGYYPRDLFDSNGLRDKAAEVDFGGEIVDEQVGGQHTRTDMGSGHFPGDGFGFAAYQRQIRYITTSNVWGTHASLDDSRTDSDCYDIEVHDSDGSWERYFYFGGPGFNSHCQ